VEETDRIVVLGIGNVLLHDDGFGPYVVRQLEARWELPEPVRVIDGGTPGLDFHPFFEGTRLLIVVDTVRSAGQPGELKLYRRDELLEAPLLPRTTPHEPGLGEALHAGRFAGEIPDEVLLVGVCAEEFSTGTGLTPAVRGAVDPALEAIVEELRRAGVTPRRREPPGEPDIWWESASGESGGD
jgi:hydrogenase maturation protease